MKSDAVAFGVAGILFGLIAGWVIGSQQAARAPAAARAVAAPARPAGSSGRAARRGAGQRVESRGRTRAVERRAARAARQMYFDAERYDEAIKWYTEALQALPNDVDVSTDLGVLLLLHEPAGQGARAVRPIAEGRPEAHQDTPQSGIVRAFGKQDLDGASRRGSRSSQLAPASPEAQAARRALDTLRSAHPRPARGTEAGCLMLRAYILHLILCRASAPAPSGG